MDPCSTVSAHLFLQCCCGSKENKNLPSKQSPHFWPCQSLFRECMDPHVYHISTMHNCAPTWTFVETLRKSVLEMIVNLVQLAHRWGQFDLKRFVRELYPAAEWFLRDVGLVFKIGSVRVWDLDIGWAWGDRSFVCLSFAWSSLASSETWCQVMIDAASFEMQYVCELSPAAELASEFCELLIPVLTSERKPCMY